jgi:hypothetical protein
VLIPNYNTAIQRRIVSMPDVHIPLIGDVPKTAVILGLGGGAIVVGYILWQRHKANAGAAAAATGYGYGAAGYGTGTPGYYGYGYGYGSDFTGYPSGETYGYGAFGYGMYNPVTGQYYGAGGGGYPYGYGTPPSWWTTAPSWFKKTSGTGKPGTSVITSQGHLDLYRIAREEGISLDKLLRLNPHLKHYEGTGKHIPRGTRIKV